MDFYSLKIQEYYKRHGRLQEISEVTKRRKEDEQVSVGQYACSKPGRLKGILFITEYVSNLTIVALACNILFSLKKQR